MELSSFDLPPAPKTTGLPDWAIVESGEGRLGMFTCYSVTGSGPERYHLWSTFIYDTYVSLMGAYLVFLLILQEVLIEDSSKLNSGQRGHHIIVCTSHKPKVLVLTSSFQGRRLSAARLRPAKSRGRDGWQQHVAQVTGGADWDRGESVSVPSVTVDKEDWKRPSRTIQLERDKQGCQKSSKLDKQGCQKSLKLTTR
ncbi:hypothetical protein EJB05_11837, partial [Eragrostis curvula]